MPEIIGSFVVGLAVGLIGGIILSYVLRKKGVMS